MERYTSFDLTEWGEPFEEALHEMPQVTGREVLVRITASGLCHSDLHIKKGFMDLGEKGKLTFTERGATLPLTLGHEMAGDVAAAGPDATVTAGQSVVIFPWIGCRNCTPCDEDRESDCTSMRILGIHRNGGFATHVVVEDEKFLVDIQGLDPAKVAPYACSGLTVYNALSKVGPLRDGQWLAILGAGGLGLNAVAIAKALGYRHIIAVDIDDAKLEAAQKVGASQVVNARADDAVDQLKALTDNQLFGVVDTFGSEQTGALAVTAMTKAATYVVVGQHGGDFKMPQIWLPQKAMTVRGSHVGNSPQLATLIQMYRDGKLQDIPIETRPLSAVNEAIDDLHAGRVTGRIVFVPDTLDAAGNEIGE